MASFNKYMELFYCLFVFQLDNIFVERCLLVNEQILALSVTIKKYLTSYYLDAANDELQLKIYA